MRKFLIIIATLIASVSCNRKAQLVYLNDVTNETLGAIKAPVYLIKPGDVLSIQIYTQDPNISQLFNLANTQNTNASYNTEISSYISGFSVNDSGQVNLPVIGKVKISELSVRDAQESIQQAANKYLKDALVVVKLLSFRVTVLGEVKLPGTYTNYKDNLNIFEAIGMAGDLTDFGERSNVLVLRNTPQGVKTFRMNLQDKNIVTSEGFFLQPNDTVIVEPRKGKVMALNTPNIQLILSTLTTVLLFLNFLKK
ncbi:polysaccharide biosynthesis/export family protein [Tenuifilum thalassicum]|uniref:Sugar transporter n=1 Tax=Tenuifilum thalassicum TaxID=2590900 RepID=A0A7D3XJR0_9BACT|nr:polysaccharide biosynthesis/export family protein [Tenuifilum thalassicum]QKG78795.1 sugar transporter [Tenuifilum thalassicum]